MGRKKNEEKDQEQGGVPATIEAEQDADLDTMSGALNQLAEEGGKIILYRLPLGTVGGRPAFVAELDPATFCQAATG